MLFCNNLVCLCSFQVDFHDVQARTLAERKREEERQKRLERIYKDKVEKATKEMEGAHRTYYYYCFYYHYNNYIVSLPLYTRFRVFMH